MLKKSTPNVGTVQSHYRVSKETYYSVKRDLL